MKKILKYTVPFLFLVLTLAGCSSAKDRALKEKAEYYLNDLKGIADASESFTIKTSPSYSVRTEPLRFTVSSKYYGKEFWVEFSRDDETATDNYYTLMLQKEAEETVMGLFREIMGDKTPAYRVSFLSSAPGFTKRAFRSLKEVYEAVGQVPLILIRSNGEDGLKDGDPLDALLLALVEAGLYGTFCPYPSDALSYSVEKDGIWEVTQTGADSGAMLSRKEYHPAK